MAAGSFRGIHKLPAIGDCFGGGNFHSGVLAILHCGKRHGHVPEPRRGDKDEVDIIALGELLKGVIPV